MTTTYVDQLRAKLEEKAAFVREGLSKGVKIEDTPDGKGYKLSSEDAAAIKSAMADGKEIQELINAHTWGGEVKTWNEQDANVSTAMAAHAGMQAPTYMAKSLGEMFVQSKDFTDFQKSGRLTMDAPYVLEAGDISGMGTYGQKDVHTTSAPVQQTRGFGRTQFDPMVPRAQRVNRVRDLFPVAATNANNIDFFKVTGFLENGGSGNAQTVAERNEANDAFAIKPKSNLQFTADSAQVRTIAHWEAAHRNVLQDEPQLQSTINNELLYGLALEEDDQILNGDGVGENLRGILNTPDIQVYTQGAAPETKADALRKAATLSILANYPSTGYVVHPNDWEDIELSKDNEGRYILVTNVAIGAEARVWRQPVVETPAIPEGTFLSGAFGLGAQLYDRQSANVRISEQHEDFFVRNAVAILCEERLALAVKRPESFIKGTFTA